MQIAVKLDESRAENTERNANGTGHAMFAQHDTLVSAHDIRSAIKYMCHSNKVVLIRNIAQFMKQNPSTFPMLKRHLESKNVDGDIQRIVTKTMKDIESEGKRKKLEKKEKKTGETIPWGTILKWKHDKHYGFIETKQWGTVLCHERE